MTFRTLGCLSIQRLLLCALMIALSRPLPSRGQTTGTTPFNTPGIFNNHPTEPNRPIIARHLWGGTADLMSRARLVTAIRADDSYRWVTADVVEVYDRSRGVSFCVDTRTRRHTRTKWTGRHAKTLKIPPDPDWFFGHAVIVGYDVTPDGREVWADRWSNDTTFKQALNGVPSLASNHHYEIWISARDERVPHLQGSAPLSFSEVTAPNHGNGDLQWLPGGKAVSFIYHGGLYVLPIVGPGAFGAQRP